MKNEKWKQKYRSRWQKIKGGINGQFWIRVRERERVSYNMKRDREWMGGMIKESIDLEGETERKYKRKRTTKRKRMRKNKRKKRERKKGNGR